VRGFSPFGEVIVNISTNIFVRKLLNAKAEKSGSSLFCVDKSRAEHSTTKPTKSAKSGEA